MDFLAAIAKDAPQCKGSDSERTVDQKTRMGWSGSVTEQLIGTVKEKVYHYKWSWIVTITVTCKPKAKEDLTVDPPQLAMGGGVAPHGGESALASRIRQVLDEFGGQQA